MARTGFCESKPLLDFHKKADERRAPLRTWSNACGPVDRCQPEAEVVESKMAPVKMEPERRWERRLSAQTSDGIIMGFHDDCLTQSAGSVSTPKIAPPPQGLRIDKRFSLHVAPSPPRPPFPPCVADGCVEERMLLLPHGLQGLHSLQALVPSLLRHEVEAALEKLDLAWDRAYAWDMFLDMMRTQTRNSFPNADLLSHFTDATRSVLVDWLIQVHMMHFQEETLYLGIHLLNRSLREVKVSTVNLQLLGMVCLFLAAKKEECLLPEVSGLCYLMDHTYTKHQLLRMERKVLFGLKFDLSYCPPLHFLLLLASVARCSAKAVWMARYLLELSLLEGQCVVFLPVQLAGAALFVSRQVLQEPPTPGGEAAWCLAASVNVGSEAAMVRIMHILANAASKAHTRETCATFIKFSSPETMQVSRHPGLKTAAGLLGLCT
ncbi:cyclin N-terminal domain-containing protein 2 isoform X2 [Pungitius pungitius]|uniref:cyclin N-terminal domain-containing protein 2 isoform X2 n=1 Tax=Pungitius pungitius TaxID=134920 RepID=UPI002E14E82B